MHHDTKNQLDARTLNQRQQDILWLASLHSEETFSVSHLFDVFSGEVSYALSLPTLKRDVRTLADAGFLLRVGKGRGTAYRVAPRYLLNRSLDRTNYFKKEADRREGRTRFNFEILDALDGGIFTGREIEKMETLNSTYRRNVSRLPENIHDKELARLIIEFSWKSSRIEGNTYSLLETERLLTEHEEASGHSREEAMMLLNHKRALEFVLEHSERFRQPSLGDIEEIHRILVEGLNTPPGFRAAPVGIVGTIYKPLDNQFQIREAMEKTAELIRRATSPIEQAFLATFLVAYIQPFSDGNKRTSRLLGNAMLVANDWCPLSYRSVDETTYKQALILFYEQNTVYAFKRVFMEQFKFAVEHYFS